MSHVLTAMRERVGSGRRTYGESGPVIEAGVNESTFHGGTAMLVTPGPIPTWDRSPPVMELGVNETFHGGTEERSPIPTWDRSPPDMEGMNETFHGWTEERPPDMEGMNETFHGETEERFERSPVPTWDRSPPDMEETFHGWTEERPPDIEETFHGWTEERPPDMEGMNEIFHSETEERFERSPVPTWDRSPSDMEETFHGWTEERPPDMEGMNETFHGGIEEGETWDRSPPVMELGMNGTFHGVREEPGPWDRSPPSGVYETFHGGTKMEEEPGPWDRSPPLGSDRTRARSAPVMNLGVNRSTFHGNISGGINSGNTNSSTVYGDVHVHSPSAASRKGSPKDSRKEIADWVSPLDFGPIQAQALNKRTSGTLKWAIASPKFKNWRSRRGGFLWCPGPPGAGKTVWASFVIDQLQKDYYKVPQLVSAVCYIYYQYSKKLSVLQTFEAILKQLILSCPSIDIKGIKKMKDQGRRLPLDEIIFLLQFHFRRLSSTFVIIDALDECFPELDRHHLLERMQSFLDVNILVTSRDLPYIKSTMTGVTRLDIYAIPRDVRIHLRAQRKQSPHLTQLMARANISSSDIEEKVITRAGGMFLLADRHVEYLLEQTNVNGLIQALDTLPTSAAASHASAIGRIKQQRKPDKTLAYIVLSLISYALRSFKSLELRHAAATVILGRVAFDSDLVDEERIISVCAGLIIVNMISKEVGFIHYTVQEYLEQIRQGSNFISEVEITNSFTRLICTPGIQVRPPNHPLIEYAADVWPQHVQHCEADGSILETIFCLLANPVHIEIVCSMWNPYNSCNHWRCEKSGVQAMHLLAAFGLTKTAKQFLQQHPGHINQRDVKRRTPLSWAAINGHPDTVWMLLEVGNTRSLSPLWRTIKKAFANIPKSGVNEKANQGRTPRSHAFSEVVKLLFNTGKVKVNTKDTDAQTPFSYAVEKGHSEVVKLLLGTGKVKVDERHPYGRTPLSIAAKNGQSGIVKLLLDTGRVKVDAKDDGGQTPLSHAAVNGHLEVVKLLVNTGKVVDATDNAGRAPLSHAAEKGHLEVVRLLMQIGEVNVAATDFEGRTACSYARANNHSAVAWELERKGFFRYDYQRLLGSSKGDTDETRNTTMRIRSDQ